MNRYPRQRTIAVDVDGTLSLNGEINLRLIEWLKRRKDEGYFLLLWSAQGIKHAKETAERFQVSSLFDVIISKPGYIVDDRGWSWISFTQWCRSFHDLEPKRPAKK